MDDGDQSSSLLELCEKEEWELICGLIPKMIHLWNFEEKNAQGNNALIICCKKGSLHVLQQLYIAKCKTIKCEKIFGEENSNLLFACYFGHLEIAKWLLKHGSSIHERNKHDNSCVLLAALNGKLKTLKWLIENGCSIHEKNKKGIWKDI